MTSIAFLVLAAGVAFAAGAASAQTPLANGASSARLVIPVSRPVEKLIDGRDWSCAGDLCTAAHQDTAESMPLWMECSDAAAEFGAFSAYQTGSDRLEPAKLVRCNAHAKDAPQG